jgi:hypothetical protein
MSLIPRGVANYVRAAIDALATDPTPAGCELIGNNIYRISEWGYIIEYEIIQSEILIRILYIG